LNKEDIAQLKAIIESYNKGDKSNKQNMMNESAAYSDLGYELNQPSYELLSHCLTYVSGVSDLPCLHAPYKFLR